MSMLQLNDALFLLTSLSRVVTLDLDLSEPYELHSANLCGALTVQR